MLPDPTHLALLPPGGLVFVNSLLAGLPARIRAVRQYQKDAAWVDVPLGKIAVVDDISGKRVAFYLKCGVKESTRITGNNITFFNPMPSKTRRAQLAEYTRVEAT